MIGRLAPTVSSAHALAVAPERRIARQRAVEHVDGEERAGRVPDDNDLVGVGRAHRVDNIAGERFHALFPVGPLAVRELVGRDAVVAEIKQIGLLLGHPEKATAKHRSRCDADKASEPGGRAERGDQPRSTARRPAHRMR